MLGSFEPFKILKDEKGGNEEKESGVEQAVIGENEYQVIESGMNQGGGKDTEGEFPLGPVKAEERRGKDMKESCADKPQNKDVRGGKERGQRNAFNGTADNEEILDHGKTQGGGDHVNHRVDRFVKGRIFSYSDPSGQELKKLLAESEKHDGRKVYEEDFQKFLGAKLEKKSGDGGKGAQT